MRKTFAFIKILIYLYFLSNSTIVVSETTSAVGINLESVVDWSTEIPFVDAFKSSRQWVTQNENVWDTGEFSFLDLDEKGWVKSLPKPEDNLNFTTVATLMFRDIDSHYPAGSYIVLYEGEGQIEYDFSAKKNEVGSTPGRDVLDVDPNVPGGILLRITKTDPNNTGNYIRNIRVILPGHEESYQTNPFNPLFLDAIKPFKVLRFLNWMRTNNSQPGLWTHRALPEHARYSNNGGVPLEIMVSLANTMQADPWFTIPHTADNQYIQKFSRFVKKELSPDRKIYVEYSNEIWNAIFSQAKWIEAQGLKEWPEVDATPFTKRINWYGKRVAEICSLWKKAFNRDRHRVICVLSGQAANAWVAKQALECPLYENAPCVNHGISALAIAPYFGGYIGDPQNEAILAKLANAADFEQSVQTLLTEIKNGGLLPNSPDGGALAESIRWIKANAKTSRDLEIKLLAYEGGQHLVGTGNVVNNASVENLFKGMNRFISTNSDDIDMYSIYLNYLDEWKKAGGGLFLHYSSIGKYSRWGSWGSLEFLDFDMKTPPSSPKYNALIEHIKVNLVLQ